MIIRSSLDYRFFCIKFHCFSARKYNDRLNTELGWYLNRGSMYDWPMIEFLNGIWIPDWYSKDSNSHLTSAKWNLESNVIQNDFVPQNSPAYKRMHFNVV
jgi:hypothetical protein